MGKDDRRWNEEADRLRQARSATHALLTADADLEALRLVARELGNSLIETADDRALWRALAKAQRHCLSDEHKVDIAAASDIDWVPLLNRIGYQPPPPVEVYGAAFAEAMQRAVEGQDVKATRKRVRDLGEALLRLSGAKKATKSGLRRLLRRGLRVAGSLIVIVASAAAGVVVREYVRAHLGDIQGDAAGSAAEKIAEKVLVTAGKGVEWVLDRVVPERDDGAAADRLADTEAAQSLLDVSDDELHRLLNQWREGAGGVADSKTFVNDTVRRLYVAWEAGFGAPWFTEDLAHQFTRLLERLTTLRDALNEPTPIVDSVAAAFGTVSEELHAAKTQLRSNLGHEPNNQEQLPDPDEGHDGQSAGSGESSTRADLITGLESQIAETKIRLKRANLNLVAAQQADPLRKRTKAETALGISGCQSNVDAIQQELDKLTQAHALLQQTSDNGQSDQGSVAEHDGDLPHQPR